MMYPGPGGINHRDPTVFISHRCKEYDDWEGRSTLESLLKSRKITIQYGCSLQYSTGDIPERCVKLAAKSDGFISVVIKNWSREEEYWPLEEYNSWYRNHMKNHERIIALIIDGTKLPDFLYSTHRHLLWVKKKKKNMMSLPSLSENQKSSDIVQSIFINKNEKDSFIDALDILAKKVLVTPMDILRDPDFYY